MYPTALQHGGNLLASKIAPERRFEPKTLLIERFATEAAAAGQWSLRNPCRMPLVAWKSGHGR